MKAIYLIAFKNLTYRPGRSVSCAVGIALGLAIVMAVQIVDRNTILSQISLRPPAYGEPDVEIRPRRPVPGMTEEQRAWLERQEGMLELAALFSNNLGVRSISGAAVDLPVFALDERAASGFNAYRVRAGLDLDFSGPPNLLLSDKAAKRLKAAPGDIVRVWPSTPVRQICKDGKLVTRSRGDQRQPPPIMEFKVQGILTEEHLGLGLRAIIPFDQGVALFKGEYILPVFWAKLAPGVDLTAIQTLLKTDFTVEKPYQEALVGESFEERAFRNGVRVCAVLSLLLGLYVIFNSMSMSLVERIRQIGLLRAMGLTRSGLYGLFLMEGFFLTLLGCLISVGLTALIVYYMKWQKITTLGFGRPLEIVEIPWLQLAGVMLLGIVFSLLGVIYPVGKASALSVIQAIRRGTIEYEIRPFKGVGRLVFFLYVLLIPLAYFIFTPMLSGRFLDMFMLLLYAGIAAAAVVGLLLFFPIILYFCASAALLPFSLVFKVTGRLAANSVATSRLRIFSTVSGLALVFSAIFVISAVTDSLLSETAAFADENVVRNLFVRGKQPGVVQERELETVEGVGAVLNLSAVINCPFPVRGLKTTELVKYGLFKGRTDFQKKFDAEDWIIISSRLAKVYSYKIGDRIKLSTSQAGLKVFKIVAISDLYGFYPDDRGFAAISAEKMVNYFCIAQEPGQRWSLRLDEDGDPEAIKKTLEAKLGQRAQVTSGQDLKEEYLTDLKNNFTIFTVVILLVALLACVSILNSLVIAVTERRRETALLRVVGLTPGQSRSMLLMEACGLGALGGFFGVLLGLPVTLLTVHGLRRISYLDLELTIRPETVLMTFFGALLVSVAASLYPIFRQGASDLMEAVKCE